MGRYYWNAKTTVDSLKRIEIWWLKKKGYLKPGWMSSTTITWTHGFSGSQSSIGLDVFLQHFESPRVRFHYTQTNNEGEKKSFDYNIPLLTTECNLGGKRYWFQCPWYANGKYCGRRVGVVYKSGDVFACRHCYNLSYDSRNETRGGRLAYLFGPLMTMKKIDDQWAKTKRTFYAGKPTKKYRKILRLERRLENLRFNPQDYDLLG